jgi:aspartyl-tRNA(Asn)/glutamyl-tRNA(Gln) amidotransferase subunit C
MKVDLEETRRIAALAHLEFDDAGLARMAAEMSKILAYVDQLQRIDVEGLAVEELTPMTLREDDSRASTDRTLVERNAPAWRERLFVVPRVIGGE